MFDYAEKIRELNYSPDFRVLWAFEAHEPEIDAINEQLKEPTLSAEYRKELETELNAAKRRLVDAVNEARGQKKNRGAGSESPSRDLLCLGLCLTA